VRLLRWGSGRSNVELLNFGQRVAIQRDVFAQSFTTGLEHRGNGVDDQLGTRQVRGCRGEL